MSLQECLSYEKVNVVDVNILTLFFVLFVLTCPRAMKSKVKGKVLSIKRMRMRMRIRRKRRKVKARKVKFFSRCLSYPSEQARRVRYTQHLVRLSSVFETSRDSQ